MQMEASAGSIAGSTDHQCLGGSFCRIKDEQDLASSRVSLRTRVSPTIDVLGGLCAGPMAVSVAIRE